jgi:4a-hydroxytetrahydrobiopterin dehydratase
MSDPKPTKLTDEQLAEAMTPLTTNGWRMGIGGDSRELVRDFVFKDFVAAMQFVNRLAQAAESAGHHPDIDIRYSKVRVALVTHDAGGITQKDVHLAQITDKLA